MGQVGFVACGAELFYCLWAKSLQSDFRDPEYFVVGGLHEILEAWKFRGRNFPVLSPRRLRNVSRLDCGSGARLGVTSPPMFGH